MILKALRDSFYSCKYELRNSIFHYLAVKKAAKYTGNNLKLHVGSGDIIKKGWINIDLDRRADLMLDLREPLPFPDNSCSIVYSEHLFEHLDYENEGLPFLLESYRVLKPGGIFSMGIPDTEPPLKAYVEGKKAKYWQVAKEYNLHPADAETMIQKINAHFRQYGEHKYSYDWETVQHLFKRTPFKSVKKRSFDPKRDSETRKNYTLYVDAVK